MRWPRIKETILYFTIMESFILKHLFWTQIITALVALFGLVISIISLVRQIRSEKPKVKIELSSDPHEQDMIYVAVKNIGHIPILLSDYFLITPQKPQWHLEQLPIIVEPIRLEPHKQWREWDYRIGLRGLASELNMSGFSGNIKIRVAVKEDLTNNTYKSKPYKLNIEEWLEKT